MRFAEHLAGKGAVLTRAADSADVKTVQARLRQASAKTTLDTYGHLWPDRDESTRATIEAVFVTRETEQSLNQQGSR